MIFPCLPASWKNGKTLWGLPGSVGGLVQNFWKPLSVKISMNPLSTPKSTAPNGFFNCSVEMCFGASVNSSLKCNRDVVIRINGQMQNSSVSSCHVAKWTHHSSSLDSSWNILSKNMRSWVINTHIYKKQNQVQEAPPFRSLPTSCPCSMASQTFSRYSYMPPQLCSLAM